MLARCMIIALPLSVAFTSLPRRSTQLRESSVALTVKNDGITEGGRAAGAVLFGLALVTSPLISSAAVPMTDSIASSLQSSDLVISKVRRSMDAPRRDSIVDDSIGRFVLIASMEG